MTDFVGGPAATKEDNVLDVINKPEQRKKFKSSLATLTHYLQMIEDQKEGMKETIADLSAESGIDKKTIRRLASVMYKCNYADLQEENEHFELLYETLIEERQTSAPADDDE